MRIVFESGTTQTQKNDALIYTMQERRNRDEELKARNPEFFMEIKKWFFAHKNDIFHNPRNSHLRKAQSSVDD